MSKVIDVPIQKLKPYADNPRNNALAVDKVKASIERVGFMFPIIIDMNHEIIAGHTRHAACLALGRKTMPCIMAESLDPEQVALFRYVDNKSSEYASWDYEKLAAELRMIDAGLAPNDFILKSFDFDLEAHELDAVPHDVPISTFNFMGDDYKKQSDKAEESDISEEDGDGDESGGGFGGLFGDGPPDGDPPDLDVRADGSGGSGKKTESDGAPEASAFGSEDRKPAPSIIRTFRCGASRFIISEREEARLLEAYTKYMAEIYPESSFIKYLLGGRDIAEIPTERSD